MITLNIAMMFSYEANGRLMAKFIEWLVLECEWDKSNAKDRIQIQTPSLERLFLYKTGLNRILTLTSKDLITQNLWKELSY